MFSRTDISEHAFRQIVWSGGTFSVSVSKIIEFNQTASSQNLILALRTLDDDLDFRQPRYSIIAFSVHERENKSGSTA